MQNKTFFLVGMPESGKTSYLGALCRLLILAEKTTMLRLDSAMLPEGFEEIEAAVKKIGAFEEVGRTLKKNIYNITLPLSDGDGNEIRLMIPDLTGEYFRDLVCDRRIKKEIAEKMMSADEILFFINVNTMAKETRFSLREKSAVKRLNEESSEEILSQQSLHASKEDSLIERKRKKANQSEVVDLLQSVVYIKRERLKIKFVVSAWDKVEKEYLECSREIPSPELFIKKELPLLYQYIISNLEIFDYQIWGVSAQGGDFNVEEDKKALIELGEFELIKVVDGEKNESHDLTKLLYV